jgi:predicted DCC family thiol-disulfide oxidoreductase YuxK
VDSSKPPITNKIPNRKGEFLKVLCGFWKLDFAFHNVHTSMNIMKSHLETSMISPNTKIKVYFDGLCKVCSKEINHYKKQIGAERIEFVDICSPLFDAASDGLDPIKIHKEMHVRRQDGSVVTRVESFIEIWNVLPKYNWLSMVARRKPVRIALEIGYTGFTMVRPYLPRYANPADCQDSPYCEVKRK